MKSYTDISQSKKLAEILPLESADMYYHNRVDIPDNYPLPIEWKRNNPLLSQEIPCWSLAALLDVVSEEVSLNSFKDGNWNAMVQHNGKMIYGDTDNPVDACVAMIEKLHELKML